MTEFKKRLVVNSRFDPELAKLSTYNVYTAPPQYNTVPYASSTCVPGQAITFNIPINSPGILSRDMYIKGSIDVTLTREANGAVNGWSSGVNCSTDPLGILLSVPVGTYAEGIAAWNNSKPLNALTSFAIQRQCKSASITLNGASITTQMSEWLNMFETVISEDTFMNSEVSMAPVMRDNGQSFQYTNNKQKNPLQRYSDSGLDVETRGGTVQYQVLPFNPDNSARSRFMVTVRVPVCEKILIQPLATNALMSEMCGFIGITNLQMQFNLGSPQSLIWSCNGYVQPDPAVGELFSQTNYTPFTSAEYAPATADATYLGPPPSGISYQFVGNQCQLLLQTYSPPSFVPLSGCYFYSYDNVLVNTTSTSLTTAPTLVPGVSTPLPGMPRYICVFAKRTNPSAYQPNVTALIDRASFTIGNQSGLLSNADDSFLYMISRQGGSLLSWPEWSNACGSVLMIDTSKSLALNDQKVIGENGTIQFQCNATCRLSPYEAQDNGLPLAGPVAYNLFYLFVFESLLEIDYDNGGAINLYQSIISENDRRELFVQGIEDYTNSLAASGGYITGGANWYQNIVSRVKSFLRPKVQKLKDLSDKYGQRFDKSLDIWKDNIPEGVYNSLSNASSGLQDAINQAHESLSGGMLPGVLWGMLAARFGPKILAAVKNYLVSNGVVDGSGRYTGKGLGPSVGIGGRRAALRR